jgi:phosphatidylglycerophosphate synthase
VDGADGEIARLKFMETDIGKKLDIYCDNIIHFLVFTAIGCGVYFKTGESIFLYLGGFAGLGGLTAFFLLSPILLEKRSPSNQLFHINEPELAEKFANRDFIHFLLLVAVVDQMEIFIAVAAVGANLFAGYLIYSRLLKLKTA